MNGTVRTMLYNEQIMLVEAGVYQKKRLFLTGFSRKCLV